MVCACVDIGTNTTRVLVGDADEGRLTEILQQRVFTRIGKGLKPGTEIPRPKIDEVSRVVAEQAALARSVGAAHVRVVATAAIRGAANQDRGGRDPRRRRGGAARVRRRHAHVRPRAAGPGRRRRRRRRLQ
jgi:exopolyphosphatase/guanosine-5'-triphosphate,3'-diphosphate pyrophosphatase